MIATRTLVALIVGLAGASAGAQPQGGVDPGAPGTQDRSLAGHVFTPSLLVRSPFAVTAFGADLLYGTGTATGPSYDVAGFVVGDETYTFAAMGQNFSYERKVAEGVSLGGGAVSQLYSGIDGPSAVVVGAEIAFGAFLRGTAGRRFGPVQAAFTFDASYAPRIGILVFDAIEKALREGELESGAALAQTNAWTFKPGLALAWAPHRALGLTASADYQWVSLDTEDPGTQEQDGVDAGIAADLDFGTFTSVPVALVAAYHTTAPLGSRSVTRVIDVSGGVYYTGRPALVLGLEVAQRSFTLRELDSDGVLAQIRLLYLW